MENSSHDEIEKAEDVGRLLAEAFIARVKRYPPASRKPLLIACHHRLLQEDAELAAILFQGH